MEKDNGVKLVSSAIVGLDCETVIVNGKMYVIAPPTIARISGAGTYLSDLNGGGTLKDVLGDLKNFNAYAHALSWFIKGDDSLFEEFLNTAFDEVAEALGVALKMLSPENFIVLSTLVKNVSRLIANAKQ